MRYEQMIPKLPDIFTRLEEMESFDLGETKADLERQRDNIKQLLQDLFRYKQNMYIYRVSQKSGMADFQYPLI